MPDSVGRSAMRAMSPAIAGHSLPHSSMRTASAITCRLIGSLGGADGLGDGVAGRADVELDVRLVEAADARAGPGNAGAAVRLEVGAVS